MERAARKQGSAGSAPAGPGPVRLLSQLALLVGLHVAGLALFTRGFMLTRVELPGLSSCDDYQNAQWSSPSLVSNPSSHQSQQSQQPQQSQQSQQPQQSQHSHHSPNTPESAPADGDIDAPWGDACVQESPFDRVVILVIDAARFDFAVNTTGYTRGGRLGSWVAGLPSLERFARQRPNSTALFKFVADPPTTSQQRLKGLMTGGLPTFVDVGSSFGSMTISEDNLLVQLQAHGRRVELIGDDTWLDLFPTHFARATPFPSLVVKDIHTVDNGVLANLFPALQREDWDVLIGHYLGVDHVGHTFCVESDVMTTKLTQMDHMIRDVVEALEAEAQSPGGGRHKSTLLLVMSDHGQTLTGDHGGGTPEETDAILFAMVFDAPPEGAPRPLLFPAGDAPPDSEAEADYGTLPQIDFAPTMATLLGVPIPYASVGTVNGRILGLSRRMWAAPKPPAPPLGAGVTPEAGDTPDAGGTPEAPTGLTPVALLGNYLRLLRYNSWQVQRYLSTYSASAPTPFPHAHLSRLEALYRAAQSRAAHTQGSTDSCRAAQAAHGEGVTGACPGHAQGSTDTCRAVEPAPDAETDTVTRSADCPVGKSAEASVGVVSVAELERAIAAHSRHLGAAAEMARAQWTQFGGAAMCLGLGTLLLSLLLHAALIRSLCRGPGAQTQASARQQATATGEEQAPGRRHQDPPTRQQGPGTLQQGSSTGQSMSSFPPSMGWVHGWGWQPWAACTFTLMLLASLFSNSYIESEGFVVSFLLGSWALLHMRASAAAKSKRLFLASLGLLLCNSLLSRLGLSAVLHKAPDTLDTTKAPTGEAGPGTPLPDLWPLLSHLSLSLSSLLPHLYSTLSDLPGSFVSGLASLYSLFSVSSLLELWGAAKASLATYLSPGALKNLAHLASLHLASLSGIFDTFLVPVVATYIPLVLLPSLLLQPRAKLLSLLARQKTAPPPPATANGDSSRLEVPAHQGHKGSATNTHRSSSSSSSSTTRGATAALGPAKAFPLHWRGPGVALSVGVWALYVLVGLTWGLEDLAQAGVHHVSVPPLGLYVATAGPFARLSLPRCVYSLTLALLLPSLLLPLAFHPAPARPPSPTSGAPSSPSTAAQSPEAAKLLVLCGYALDAVSVLSAVVVLLGGRRAACIPLLSLLQGLFLLQANALHEEPRTSPHAPSPSLPLPADGPLVEGASSAEAETPLAPEEREDRAVGWGGELVCPAMQWSFFSVLLFFASGHRCTFDRLHYAAAFTGYDDFQYHRQGTLLALNTFGLSHLLAVLALPLLTLGRLHTPTPHGQHGGRKAITLLFEVLLSFLLPQALAATATTLFVSIERRHLMTWAVFAPKFMFDAVGLLLLDTVLMLLACLSCWML